MKDAFTELFPPSGMRLRMYGESSDRHIAKLRSGIDTLEMYLQRLQLEASCELFIDTEFAAVSLHDQLNDIAVWLRGARGGLDRNLEALQRLRDQEEDSNSRPLPEVRGRYVAASR